MVDRQLHLGRIASVAVALAVLGLYADRRVSVAQGPGPADSCARLSSLTLSGTTISATESVAAGAFAPPAARGGAAPSYKTLPAFCRVSGAVARTGDTDVKFEVWLPSARGAWNGEFQPAGSGFAGGAIAYAEMAEFLRAGRATANTNRGHDGGGPWKLSDMGHEPYHLTVDRAKAIVAAFYGSAPKLTVMNQCGGGGSRDALMEVQNHPEDLDAAVAQGIVYYATHHGIAHMWVYQATHKDEASYIPPNKYPLINQAAVNACDMDDRIKDGVISDPTRCRFDPGRLLCKGADAADCLTAPQVAAVRQIYTTPVHARTKAPLYGSMPPGGELGWEQMAGPAPYPYSVTFYRNLVFKDQSWDYKTHPVNFDTDVDKADAPENLVINANNPDVSRFVARGGKLLLIGGWREHTLGPASNVDYYESVVKKIGAKAAGEGVRLFMIPTMDHCLGESYANAPTVNFDAVAYVKQWKASGIAARSIVVTESEKGIPDRRRLVCAYPEIAVYNRRGDAADPASYQCARLVF